MVVDVCREAAIFMDEDDRKHEIKRLERLYTLRKIPFINSEEEEAREIKDVGGKDKTKSNKKSIDYLVKNDSVGITTIVGSNVIDSSKIFTNGRVMRKPARSLADAYSSFVANDDSTPTVSAKGIGSVMRKIIPLWVSEELSEDRQSVLNKLFEKSRLGAFNLDSMLSKEQVSNRTGSRETASDIFSSLISNVSVNVNKSLNIDSTRVSVDTKTFDSVAKCCWFSKFGISKKYDDVIDTWSRYQDDFLNMHMVDEATADELQEILNRIVRAVYTDYPILSGYTSYVGNKHKQKIAAPKVSKYEYSLRSLNTIWEVIYGISRKLTGADLARLICTAIEVIVEEGLDNVSVTRVGFIFPQGNLYHVVDLRVLGKETIKRYAAFIGFDNDMCSLIADSIMTSEPFTYSRTTEHASNDVNANEDDHELSKKSIASRKKSARKKISRSIKTDTDIEDVILKLSNMYGKTPCSEPEFLKTLDVDIDSIVNNMHEERYEDDGYSPMKPYTIKDKDNPSHERIKPVDMIRILSIMASIGSGASRSFDSITVKANAGAGRIDRFNPKIRMSLGFTVNDASAYVEESSMLISAMDKSDISVDTVRRIYDMLYLVKIASRRDMSSDESAYVQLDDANLNDVLAFHSRLSSMLSKLGGVVDSHVVIPAGRVMSASHIDAITKDGHGVTITTAQDVSQSRFLAAVRRSAAAGCSGVFVADVRSNVSYSCTMDSIDWSNWDAIM